jgi:threonylcarbamoyladenosine tRNA methylthiotransferase MtaB
LQYLVKNFGCRASQADGAALEASLEASGLRPAPDGENASLVVLNTCTVTESADQDLRAAVRRAQRDNPEAKILVTGCYAQRSPEEIAALPGVSWVVGNSHKGQIAQIVQQSTPYHAEVHIGDIFAQQSFFAAPVTGPAGDRTRPNLKIQDGCDNRCSFCIIPSVRGRSRSADADWVLSETARLAGDGFQEIVLTGINLGRWGREQGQGKLLPSLLRRLLDETSIRSIRLSSVEPMDFSRELLELMAADPRIAQHVHAPLQSGSDSVLRRMHRKYRPRHYAERVWLARELMPHAAIGADVMVGFPGESEEEFAESVAFIESLPLTYLHVFTYSERPGTKAMEKGATVPMQVRRERNQILQAVGERKNRAFRASLSGMRVGAVTLKEGNAALSSNYVRVELAQPRPANQWIDVEIGGITERGVREASPFAILP